MGKSLIDKLGLGDSATSTETKPSEPSVAAAPAAVTAPSAGFQALLEELTQKVEAASPVGGTASQRTKLAELILSTVFSQDAMGKWAPDKKLVKDWAFSLGHSIGLLAGLGIPLDRVDNAVNEIAKETKAHAKRVDAIVKALPNYTKPAGQTVNEAQVRAEAKLAEAKRHIQELKDQAEAETDPSAKAAFLRMVQRKEKELELELQGKVA